MDIITRLNEFISQRGLSSSQFADLLGIPRPSASQILGGRNKKISNEFLGKLHHAFPDLDLMWLMFGETSPCLMKNRIFPIVHLHYLIHKVICRISKIKTR